MYDLVRDLPVEIEGHRLRGHEMAFSPEFSRLTTEVELYGGGESGVGEDVTYTGLDQVAFQAEGGALPLAGSYTIGSFSEHVGEIDLFPTPPDYPASRRFRRWALESAALDLALRQAGRSLAGCAGTRGPAAQLRGLDAPVAARVRGARDGRPPAAAARALPGHALQARPHQHLDARAGGRAGGHRPGGHARPQGLLPRHAGGRGHRPGALPDGAGGVPGRLDRGRRRERRDATDPRAALASASPGTRPSTRSPTSRSVPGSPGASTSSRRGSGRSRTCSRSTTGPSARACPCTAAASPSSGWAATRSSTWPR